MSNMIPASLKVGPTTTNAVVMKRYLIFHILLMWLTVTPLVFLIAKLIQLTNPSILFIFVTFPVFLVIFYYIFLLGSFFWAWLLLKIINLFHPPREGIFDRNPKDKDYRFWSIRAIVKKFPLWISHNSPIPWADNIAFKLFGNQITLKTPIFDAWVDAEFLQVESGTLIGQGAVIMTSMITNEFLIIKRVKIGKDCLIGAHSVVSPGTVIGDEVVLGALSSTQMDQQLESRWVYVGTPARKYKESKFREKDELTSEERAMLKELEEVTDILEDEEELIARKGVKAVYQSYLSEIKQKRALKHEEKAEVQRQKAELKAEKFKYKATRHAEKARRQKLEAKIAKKKAQEALEKKLQKEKTEKDTG